MLQDILFKYYRQGVYILKYRLSQVIWLLICILFIYSCQEKKPFDQQGILSVKGDKVAPKRDSLNFDSLQNVVKDTFKNTLKPENKASASLKSAAIESLNGSDIRNITLSEFISKGAGIILNKEKSAFEVTSLIDYAPDPKQIMVLAGGFNSWSLSEFVDKGAKVVFNNDKLSPFDVLSLIKEAKYPERLYVLASKYSSTDIVKFLNEGSKVVVNKYYEPFHILSFIDKGKDRTEVDCRGISSNWIMNFIERGGTVRLDASFQPFHILEFAKAAGKRAVINGNGFSPKNLERFAKAGAKLYLGKFRNPEQSNKFLNSYEIADIIKIKPENITVFGDGFDPVEITEFISLGAKIVFRGISDIYDISDYIDGVVPPSKSLLGEQNFKKLNSKPGLMKSDKKKESTDKQPKVESKQKIETKPEGAPKPPKVEPPKKPIVKKYKIEIHKKLDSNNNNNSL